MGSRTSILLSFNRKPWVLPATHRARSFYGPGMFNSDLALLRSFQLSEAKALQFRLETFNTFNHAQFFGPAAVNGDLDSDLFGRVVKAAPPRLMQLGASVHILTERNQVFLRE